MNVNINKFVNILLFSLLIYFCISYFLKINYSVFNKDEIIYLSDSLLLLEGLRPSHSHSPSGISTWFGSLVVLLDFLISNITFASITGFIIGSLVWIWPWKQTHLHKEMTQWELLMYPNLNNSEDIYTIFIMILGAGTIIFIEKIGRKYNNV